MSIFRWLKAQQITSSRRPTKRTGKPRRGYRPGVECLENRLAPATLTVNSLADNTTDTSHLTLRDAITLVNHSGDPSTLGQSTMPAGWAGQIGGGEFGSVDTILFDSSLSGGTITLGGTALPNITKGVTITGLGASLLAVSGNNKSTVFSISSATVTMTGLTIEGGNATFGGGLFTNGSTNLTISNSTFSSNTAIYGGALYTRDGTVTLNNDTFSGNSATNWSGAIDNWAGGTVHVKGGTFTGNSAGDGGVIGNEWGTVSVSGAVFHGNATTNSGGAIANDGTLSVDTSTFSENSAGASGGAIDTEYSFARLSGPSTTITSSTFVSNHAANGGAVGADLGTTSVSDTTITGNSASGNGGGLAGNAFSIISSTITRNRAVNGGGIAAGSGLTLQNTIVSGNTATTSGPDIYGSIATDKGYNLLGTATISGATGTGDVFNNNPDLATLGNYGGPTQTMPPVVGSPAIGAGNNSGGPGTDQRGTPRLTGAGGDIGAVEGSVSVPTITVPASETTTLNQPIHFVTAGTPAVPQITVADSDIGTGSLTVHLKVTHGALHLGATVSLTGVQGDGTRNLQFAGSIPFVNAALANLVYAPAKDYAGSDVLDIQVADPSSASAAATVPITVLLRDKPVITVPGPLTVGTKASLHLYSVSGKTHTADIQVSDPTIGTGPMDLMLSVSDGTLKAMTTVGRRQVALSGPSVKFTGTLQEIQSVLANLVYTPKARFVGADTLQVKVDDHFGNTATQDLTIDVVANDVPVITLPAAQTVTENGTLRFRGNASLIQIADGDINVGRSLGQLKVTLQVSHGKLYHATGGLLNPIPTTPFQGTLAQVNSFLSELTYLPDHKYVGPDTLQITVVDPGNPASTANTVSASAGLSINVLAAGVPVITVPGPQTALRNTPLPLSVGGKPEITITNTPAHFVLTLSVDHGTLTAFFGGQRWTKAKLQFNVTPNQIRSLLASLVYTPEHNYVGADVLHIEAAGVSQDLAINVVVKVPPSITAPATLTARGTTPTHPRIQISDASIGKGTLHVILQVNDGMLGFINFQKKVTGLKSQLELTGTLAQINQELASLVYVANTGYVGPDTLYIEAIDPGIPTNPSTTLTAYQTVQISVNQ
jgi:hypothetical protein